MVAPHFLQPAQRSLTTPAYGRAVTLHQIAADLDEHAWYTELVDRVLADVEAFATRWAAFEELVAAAGDAAPDADEPAL